MHRGMQSIWVAVALATSSAMLACAPSLPHPAYVPQPTGALVEVDQPPPPARVEIVPQRPAPSAVWVDGEWIWRRGRWAWLTGRWVLAPAGTTFSAWVFVRGTDGKLWYAPGAWRDASGAAIDPPRALSLASVEAGAVVDADGTTETTGPILHDRPHAEGAAHPEPTQPPPQQSPR
jgi:hypothetical protein